MRPGSVTTAPAAPRSAPAATSSPRPRCPTSSAAAWRGSARRCWPARAATILELGAGTGRMAAIVLCELAAGRSSARPLRDPRGERGSRRAPARAAGRTAAGPARARGVARCAPRAALQRRDPRQRGRRCAAVPALHVQGQRHPRARRRARPGERAPGGHLPGAVRHRRPGPRPGLPRAARRPAGAAPRGLHLGGVPAACALDRSARRLPDARRDPASPTTACRAATTTTRSG